jgi:hypothetical protein
MPRVKVCLIKKGRRVGEERKEDFLGGGPVESAPITVIIIMSEFSDEWNYRVKIVYHISAS